MPRPELYPPGQDLFGIIVYLERPSQRPPGDHAVEGVPLRFVVTGTFRPL